MLRYLLIVLGLAMLAAPALAQGQEALLQAYMARIAAEFDEVLQTQLDCFDALGDRFSLETKLR